MAAVPETDKNVIPGQAPEQAYILPALDKGPASFYDTESKSFWLGIPVGRVDPLMALAVLDSAKLELLRRFQEEAVKSANASKIVKPSWAEKARQNGAALIQKLGLKH